MYYKNNIKLEMIGVAILAVCGLIGHMAFGNPLAGFFVGLMLYALYIIKFYKL